jgi:hypothetical protein
MDIEEICKRIADYIDNDTSFQVLDDNGIPSYILDVYIDEEKCSEGANEICVEIDDKNSLMAVALKCLADRVPDVVPHLERQYAKAEGYAHKYLHIHHRHKP